MRRQASKVSASVQDLILTQISFDPDMVELLFADLTVQHEQRIRWIRAAS